MILLMCSPGLFFGQTDVSGMVRDSQTQEVLVGAHILETTTGMGAYTDQSGHFSMQLPKETAALLRCTYVGYATSETPLPLEKDTILGLFLAPATDLQEAVVTARALLKPNVATLSVEALKRLPALGGRVDILKAMQLLPGIQTQNEGSSLLIVRGGNPGENLYLIDNTPLIYVNHLGGFMSVFNSDMINDVELYKGSFPARFGGRLSSIVDIAQREGSTNEWKGNLGLAVTDLSFSVEGPMPLHNSSFILTGRKTLIDPLMLLASRLSSGGNYTVSYGFHDVNAKFTWKPDYKNSFHVNFYQGDDYLNYRTKAGAQDTYISNKASDVWGNWMASARWNSVLSPKLFATNALSFSRYRLKNELAFSTISPADTFKLEKLYSSSVQDVAYRGLGKWQLGENWRMDFGNQSALLHYAPNTSNANVANECVRAFESAFFVDNYIKINNININPSLRLVYYSNNGFHQWSIEPRLGLGVSIAEMQRLHASYMKVTQNAQLLFTAGSISNKEVWVPATHDFPQASSEQFTLGWTGDFLNGSYQAEIDLYYKTLKGLATYKEGYSNLLGDGDWRAKITHQGKGTAKGAELLLRKNKGNWTGFIAYTWSNASRQFAAINHGMPYVFEYDRPHSFAISLSKKLKENLSFSFSWIYQTGLPYTPIVGRHLALPTDELGNDGGFLYDVIIYGARNSARMKDYHRLDVSLLYTKHTKKRGRKVEWNFSIYNLYNRKNPYYYYLNDSNSSFFTYTNTQNNNVPLSLYQVSFFPIIPSVSYKLYFQKAGVGKNSM